MRKGFIHIYTGDGKGKTTASVGLAVRARSRGLRVLFVQLMKSDYAGGELDLLRKISVDVRRYTEIKSPYFYPGIDLAELRVRSLNALKEIQQVAPEFDLVVIDEFNYLVSAGVLSEEEAVDFMKTFSRTTELVLTGRGATEGMIEIADYVTYMKRVKHPLKEGQRAREGIEY